jgi:serine/threonine protein kinase/Tol biopolymer transport system component
MPKSRVTAERWTQIEELFHRAAECAPEHRNALLNEACANDLELRRQVEELLSYDDNAVDSVEAAVLGGLETVRFPLTGETISHYHILDGLGGGGMGLVYRAEDIKLGRRVALKFLPEESLKDPAALGRFEREARSASALEHPNICPIYEFGEHEGQPFLVMQLLEGQTLRELIAAAGPGKPPLALSKLLDLAVQIADGLDAAHQKGIIHRDIKPANIFITQQAQAKILDFGLAKLASLLAAEGEDSEQESRGATPGILRGTMPLSTPDRFLSCTGVAMGTAGYMSPEQVRGEKLDARTDLFSFGLILYEMATGKRAFAGDTGPELQEAILTQMPSPARKVNPEVPAKLAKIVHRALEKNREARYQSASEMRADLENLKREIEPKTRERLWAMVAAVFVVLAISGAAFWFFKSGPRAALPEIKWRQLTTNSTEFAVGNGAISPDGKYLAYPDSLGIHLKQLETGEVQTVVQGSEIKGRGLGWVIGPWLPDSKSFLFNSYPVQGDIGALTSRGTSIWIVSLSGGPPHKLRDESTVDSVSPDGTLVAFETNPGSVGDREIWVMRPDGEQARRVFEGEENSWLGGLAWSPDGQRVIYFRQDGDQANSYYVSADLQGGPLTKILPPYDPIQSNAEIWLPDGRLIFRLDPPGFRTMTCNLFLIGMDKRMTKFVGKPQALTNFAEVCANPMNATADSKKVALTEWRPFSSVFVADLQVGGARAANTAKITLEESWNDPYAWTADSKAVIFASTRNSAVGLFKQFLGRDTPEPIIIAKKDERLDTPSPCLSPDGSSVVYVTNAAEGPPPQPRKLMRVPISGGTPELVLTVPDDIEDWQRCARSPATLCAIAERTADRKQLVFTAFDPVKGRGRELLKASVEATADYNWDLSPDGKRIALLKHKQGQVQILSLDGNAPQLIAARTWNTLSSVNWAADGKGFFVASYQQRGPVLLHMDLQGNTQFLWQDPGGVEVWGVPSPDGRHIAMRGWNVESNVWLMENF